MPVIIDLIKKHKSLDLPLKIELPDFSVISGVNGSGKTHLLSAILSKSANISSGPTKFEKIKYYTTASFAPQEVKTATRASVYQHADQLAQSVERNQKQRILEPGAHTHNAMTAEQQTLLNYILKESKKEFDSLELGDLYRYYPLHELKKAESVDIFYHNFSTLFKRYNDKWIDNELKEYIKAKKGIEVPGIISEEEFVATYGPAPWTFINEILLSAGLDYQLTIPIETNRDVPFQLNLKRSDGLEISFSDLSSGEKVLMSLGLALYNASYDFDFPEVLLLDEADAHLHPSMSKKFIDVIENVFVKQRGLKVIVVTHSPSTVAFAPEDSVYIMKKEPRALIKGTKDEALANLVAGVPSYSVSYENRRQVFVESHYDAALFELIYRRIKGRLELPEVSLSFIATGAEGVGSCDQVKSLVGQLRSTGNKSVFGLIDWDMNPETTQEAIFTIGVNERYSIENYILDPIVFIAYGLKYKKIDAASFGLPSDLSYFHIHTLEKATIQHASDLYFNSFKNFIAPAPTSSTLVKISTPLGIFTYPSWFLNTRGHDFVPALKKAYPFLNGDPVTGKGLTNDNQLVSYIAKHIFEDIPELIPFAFAQVLNQIKKFGITFDNPIALATSIIKADISTVLTLAPASNPNSSSSN